ncbi:hypothetical protein [Gilliamella sp. wkB112]|uniref:hypothetical protein n=1 Tax=Gilliamella sp. wkB112 TaxID=3120257 RepID=UPI00080E42D7|nr:hypothetical protein [Gilliamella apicola]OCG00823.1 hypothetical protein A9G12_03400 [Gilliamella apicola]
MNKIIQIVIVFIYIVTVPSFAQTVGTKEQAMAQQNNYWTMDYARSMLACANPSYGVKNVTMFNELIAQKDKGDPNALYIYAYLLRYYNNINHRVNLSYEQSQNVAFNIFWDLSEEDHPQSCNEIIQEDNQSILENKKISPETLLKKQLHCIDITLKNNLTDYSTYADILLFGLDKDEVANLLLPDSKKSPNEAKAIQLYENCAKVTGNRYCLARVTEAYYYGIGVAADKLKVTAWAKLAADRSVANDPFKTIQYAHELNNKLQLDRAITQSTAYKNYYTELKKLPMSIE